MRYVYATQYFKNGVPFSDLATSGSANDVGPGTFSVKRFSTDVAPTTNSSRTLGDAANHWKTAFADALTMADGGKVSVNGQGTVQCTGDLFIVANSNLQTVHFSASNEAVCISNADLQMASGNISAQCNASIYAGSGGNVCFFPDGQTKNGPYISVDASGTIQSHNSDLLLGAASNNVISLRNNTLPQSDVTFDLGSTSTRWKPVYASNARLSGMLISAGAVFTSNVSTSNNSIIMGSGSIYLSGNIGSVGTPVTLAFITSISVDTLTVSSNLTSGSVAPATDSTYDLGQPSKVWKNLYTSNAILTGSLTLASGAVMAGPLDMGSNAVYTTGNIGSSSNRVLSEYLSFGDVDTLTINSNLTLGIGSSVSIGTNLLPSSDAAYDIGSTAKQWNAIYASSLSVTGPIVSGGGITSSNGLVVASGNTTFVTGLTSSNGLVVTSGSSTFVIGLTSSNGLNVASGTATFASNISVTGGIATSNGLSVASGTAYFASNISVTGPMVSAGGITSSNGLLVTSGNTTFVTGLTSFNGLNVASRAASFGSNVSVTGPIVSAGGITSSNGLVVMSGSSTFVTGLTSSNGLVVASGTTTFASNMSVTGPVRYFWRRPNWNES
jgi:formylmethanofuran dehydrogenase subunit C